MIESLILSNLINNELFARKTLPYIKREYFKNTGDQVIFTLITQHYNKYNIPPTKNSLEINLKQRSIKESVYEECVDSIKNLKPEKEDVDWLTDETEKFCQDRALHIALREAIKLIDDKDSKEDKGVIPSLLTDALGVSFDSSIGHDYLNDSEKRFKLYHTKENKIPFDIDILNQITDGGLSNKTLTILAALTGVGKSLIMCHMAAAAISMGYDVLYITMEMSEDKIAERIDANKLCIPIKDIKNLSEKELNNKFLSIRQKTEGRLFIKEYPSGSAHAGHFRHLLNELKLKKKFKPKLIFIDYLNICASYRMKMQVGLYQYMKSIAEELRGLSTEFDLPIVTATQINREGAKDSDNIDMTNTSDSFGLPYTADLMLGITQPGELEKQGIYLWSQFKNRYGDINRPATFTTGVDKSMMVMYDTDDRSKTLPTNNDVEKDLDSLRNNSMDELFG